MSEDIRTVSAIVVLLTLILFALMLRRLGVLEEAHGKLFSRLITHVTLPALVLVSLSRSRILWADMELAVIMLAAGLCCLTLGWVVARLMRLEGKRAAAVVLASGFGNSSLLGLAVVAEVFPGDRQDLAEAAILSGLGVQPAIFLLGTLIAIYYGGAEVSPAERRRASLAYFRSPIFCAFVTGLALSAFVGPVSNVVYDKVMHAINVAAHANTFLVTLAVGLLLRFDGLRAVAKAAVLVSAVKLIVMPLLAWLPTAALGIAGSELNVLVLEAAMPSGMLGVVLCSSYGCDARFAAKLVLTTTALSVLTIPAVFALLA